jgi:hypothetical protein
MPPKFDPAQEKRISDALNELNSNPSIKIAGLARKYRVPPSTLRHRRNGRPPASTKGGHNKALNHNQNDALKGYIEFLIYIGQPPTKQAIRIAANKILIASGSTHQVGRDWVTRWLLRHKDFYKTIRPKTLQAERKATHQKSDILQHFLDFRTAIVKYGIAQDDVYNFDETGFRIGVLQGGSKVITHVATKSVYLSDPDNRESITSVECISAGGEVIPPMIVMAGKVMLEKHFDNNLDSHTLLGVSESGYSNDVLGLKWLHHFHRFTEAKKKGIWRMLVFDGHGSHLSDEFLLFAWEKKILPFLFPAHTTHLLQPLDVGVFQPFKHWHQVCLHEAVAFGDIEFSKVEFLAAFETMRKQTFKKSTILSAWKKAGLFPFQPTTVINKMKLFDAPERPVTPPQQTAPYRPYQGPFQKTPATRDRPAHQAYLETRLIDHYCDVQPITPGFYRSWKRFTRVTEPKILESLLIKDREQQRIQAEQARLRRKAGSGKHVQKNGVIYVGVARSQIKDRQETVVNMAIERQAKALERGWKSIVKAIAKDRKQWQGNRIQIISYFKSYVLTELLSC